MSNKITIRLPADLNKWLEEQSQISGLPKSRIVRAHLESSRTRNQRKPYLALAGCIDAASDLSSRKGFAR